MGIVVTWDNHQKTILRLELTTPWTWTEYDEATDQLEALLNSVDYRVDVIFDGQYSTSPPGDGYPHYRRIAESLPLNTGLILVAGVTNEAKAAANYFMPMFPELGARLAFVDSVEEARTILKDQ